MAPVILGHGASGTTFRRDNMTIFRIKPADSVFKTGVGEIAFTDDSLGPDTLIVDAGAYLTATGFDAPGARLASTGAWSVTVNGSIFSEQSWGMVLVASNPAVSTITLNADGEVGGSGGILAESAAIIRNFGVIDVTN